MYKTEKEKVKQIIEFVEYTQQKFPLNMQMKRSAKEIVEFLNKNKNNPGLESRGGGSAAPSVKVGKATATTEQTTTVNTFSTKR